MNNLERSFAAGVVELREKTLKQIQIETAIKWAGRAAAAASMNLHHDAIEYAHEAVEHAALAGDESLLREIRLFLQRHRVSV
jgi:hypothetical protein